MNYKQIYARKQINRKRILKVCPTVDDGSGIYFLTREEDGIKYAYIGQARKLLTRLAGHLEGHQWIDLSIKKHGLWSEDNPCGWDIDFVYVSSDKLDAAERDYILQYANSGYQLRNVTSGGQDKGKKDIAERKAPKGYREGVKQGEKNAQKFVANLFDKHLVYGKRSDKPNKNQDKALEKFEGFINGKI